MTKMNAQCFNKNINGFRSTYDLVYYLIDCLSQIICKKWSHCFCVDYKYRRKCELCTIVGDFNDCEELVGEKLLDKHFLLDYHQKIISLCSTSFLCQKKQLDEVYTYSY